MKTLLRLFMTVMGCYCLVVAKAQVITAVDYKIYYISNGTGSRVDVQTGTLPGGNEGTTINGSGSYTVPVSAPDQCNQPIHVEFTNDGPPTYSINIIGYSDVPGQPSCQVIPDPTDGRPGTLGGTFILTNSGQVVFRVMVTDNNTHKVTTWFYTYTVHYDNQFQVSLNTDKLCAGGSVALSIYNGYYNPAQSIYVLSNVTGVPVLWSNPSTPFLITTPGIYKAYYAGAYCNSNSVTVVDASATSSATAAGPTAFCDGGSVTLTASSNPSYLWSTGETSQSINVTKTGSYTVTGTNLNGCSATSSPIVVTVNALPAATITPSGPTTFCAGGSVTLTASPGSSYQWSTGATTSTITVSQSGSYTVTVTNSAGCSKTSAPTIVTVNPLPSATITAAGPTIFCPGKSVDLSASNAVSYLWNTGATSKTITAISGGSYSVKVTDANGCSSTSSPVTVSLYNVTQPVITPNGSTSICAGSSISLQSSAAQTYLWSTGATTRSINVTTAGSYTVKTQDGNGCDAMSSATTVVVNSLPTPTISSVLNGDGSVTLTASGGTSYKWSSGETTATITKNVAGTYTVTATGANGCQATAFYTFNCSAPKPTISAGGPTSLCAGQSVVLTASAGQTYAWSNGATTQSITVSSAGSYSVVVTYPGGCFNGSDPTTVVVNSLPLPVITPRLNADQSITLTASGGTTYSWSSGETTAAITKATSGTYTVTATNSSGCKAAASYIIRDNGTGSGGTLTITPSGATTFCQGGQVTLTATAADQYIWSTGESTRSIIAKTGGAYSVTAIFASSHTIEKSSIQVIVNPLPAAYITPLLGIDGSIALIASGGTSYKWQNDATSAQIGTQGPGTYQVVVSNQQGCSKTVSYVIDTVEQSPGDSLITVSGSLTFCTGGTVTLKADPYATDYLWSTGASTPTIVVNTSGDYVVTAVYGSQQVIKKAAVHVEVRDDLHQLYPSGSIQVSGDSVDPGEQVNLSAEVTNGQFYSWSFGDGETVGETTDSILSHYYYRSGENVINVSATSPYFCVTKFQTKIWVAAVEKLDTSILAIGNYKFNLFPNPFHDHLFFTCHLDHSAKVKIEIFLANGKSAGNYLFSCQPGDNQFELNGISRLQSGNLYLFHLYLDGKKYYDNILKF